MEATSFISSDIGVIAVMTLLVAGSIYAVKFNYFKSMGPALVVILAGIFLSNVGIMPLSSPVYKFCSGQLIFVSTAIMLFSADLKGILKLSAQPILAMFFALLSVCIVVIGGSFLVEGIPDGWKLSGMFVGTYTGGSSNLNAIGAGLQVSSDMMAKANAADYAFYTPFILMTMWMGSSLRKFGWFNKIWPYHLKDEELCSEDGRTFMKSKEWSIEDIGWLIALGFAVVAVSTYISSQIIDMMKAASIDAETVSAVSSVAKILTVTTVSIILAQFKIIKDLRGKMDLGMYIALFYLSYIGLTVDLKEFFGSALLIAMYCGVVMFGSFVLHAIFCRIFRIKYQYVILSIQAAVGSSVSASALAAASGWESLVSVGVILGVIGNAFGNYLGITVAYIVKSMLGA